MNCTETAVAALVQFYVANIGCARRTLRSHRPDLDGVCLGCVTQLGPTRRPAELAPWPCRLARAANAACEMASHRPVPKPFTADRPFLRAIEANATEVTRPMRAVARTPQLRSRHA
jgi:hypothetical protein